MALAVAKRQRRLLGGANRLKETSDWLAHIKRNSLGEVTTRDQLAIDRFIGRLKSDDTWNQLDGISFRQLGNEAIALLSLKDPEFVVWTRRGDPMFTPYGGFKGTGVMTTGPDLLCSKAPSELVKYTQNAASLGVTVSGGATTGNVFSTTDGASVSGFGIALAGSSGANQNMRCNNTSVWSVAVGSHEGSGTVVRNGANLSGYRNRALIGTSGSFASAAPAATKMTLLSSGNGREDDWLIADHVGGVLTDSQVANLHDSLAILRATLGII